MRDCRRSAAALGIALVVLASCSSSDEKAQPTSSLRPSTTVATSRTPPQEVTVDPAAGLHDGQVVRVTARGFTPGQSNIGIVQCADRGRQTGQDDCNIAGVKIVTVDATGGVASDFTVEKGPFGGAGVVCGGGQRCLLTVTQLTLTSQEFASTPITFA